MNNLKNLRKSKGVTQQDVADFLGLNRVSYTDFENGKTNIKPEYLVKLAQYFDVSIDEILIEKKPEPFGRPIEVKPELVAEDEVLIPIVGTMRCGFDSSGMPFTVYKKLPVPKSYITRWGKNIVALEAVGYSMFPTIKPKDLLIVIPGEAWTDNNIVVVDINDSDTVKRIFRAKDGGIDLVPDNEEFESMHLSPEDLVMYQVHILGRVAKVLGPDLL